MAKIPKAPLRGRSKRTVNVFVRGGEVQGVRSSVLENFLKQTLGISKQFYFRYLRIAKKVFPDSFPKSTEKKPIPTESCYLLWVSCLFSVASRKRASIFSRKGKPLKKKRCLLWGPQGPPEGKPVEYLSEVGLVVVGGKDERG